ncbi:MAG: beta-L-arabinofuranosidase domain-containing protein [Terracidiphilus sp.]
MKSKVSRRDFLAGAAAVLAARGRSSSASTLSAVQTQLDEFDYGAVQLTGGPLKAQYDRVHASYLTLDNDRLLRVYRERAGLPAPGAPMGGWYGADGFVPGHSLGQYISGLARIGRSTGDTACQMKVRELVEGFAATMGAGNRIYAAPNAEKVWPCYILDKHLAGLMDAFSLSGVEQACEMLPRVFRGALPYIPAHGHDRIGKKDPPYDETYVLPENLFSAYAITGDRAFYDRAVTYLLDREFFDPLARGEDVLPGRQAYSHAMALSSAAKARLVLGDQKYLRTLENAWQFLVAEQQYASGGWGPNELFVEPHKGQLYESLRTTVDHFETPCGCYAATRLARANTSRVGWACLGARRGGHAARCSSRGGQPQAHSSGDSGRRGSVASIAGRRVDAQRKASERRNCGSRRTRAHRTARGRQLRIREAVNDAVDAMADGGGARRGFDMRTCAERQRFYL